MNKTAIKNFAVWARRKLISDITYKAGMLGITDSGIAEPLPISTKDLQFFDIGTKDYAEVSGNEIAQRKALVDAIKRKEKSSKTYKEAFEYIVEEVAYTWFNRLIAIRFMEVNDYLPSGIRVLSSENPAKNEPDFVTTPFDTDLEFTPFEQDKVVQLKDENKLDELFCMLFIKECNKLHEILPELFEKTDDYTELLLTISFTDKDGVVYHLVHDIEEKDFDIETVDENGKVNGQVEILGWMYQYYITEKHNDVVNVRSKKAVQKEDIPAATQIFTPDWIVKYMIDNSLGNYWVNTHSDSNLKEQLQFLIDDNADEYIENVKSIEEVTVFDPCMGSGHILVYAFDVLMEIYRECGYTDRDAATSILEKNIYGIDIDKRAYQLAYFSLLMKARKYNRRILTSKPNLNLCVIEESNFISKNTIEHFKGTELYDDIVYLLDNFIDAQEYGSLLNLENRNYAHIIDYINNYVSSDVQYTLDEYELIENQFPMLKRIAELANILSKKYTVVCTNPPYNNKYDAKLSVYIAANYKIAKGDMFSAFIMRNLSYCDVDGYSAMMTPHVWMFIKSYESLREHIICHKSISSLVHLAKGAFYSEAAVDICSFVLRNKKSKCPGVYVRLEKFKGGMDVQEEKLLEAVQASECDYLYRCNSEQFLRIEGNPFSYWISEQMYENFENGYSLKSISPPRQGMATTNNDKFLRLWQEVSFEKIGFGMKDEDESADSGKRYFPYNKGGEFRRWYGNNYYVVNFENHGKEVCDYIDITAAPKFNHKNRVINREYYFKECITWADISAEFSGRYCPQGSIFDIKGSCGFPPKEKLHYILGLLNSKLSQTIIDILNPTITTQVGDMSRIPVLYGNEQRVKELVELCINYAKENWDDKEISWDFSRHPYLKIIKNEKNVLLAEVSAQYAKECDERFSKTKEAEEEINKTFIETYQMQNEILPYVEEQSISIDKADLQREIKSLISYAVGCMLGRYSLDVEGLAYAGGEWDNTKYSTFIPDADNCLPITDEEYFEDDIVGRFVKFIETVYGSNTLEENLDFIAKALGNKGNTSREVIRNYFLNDFIKDHIKIYQKRPIYWLYDSGKQNGFKALVYMHRYNADTTGNMRVEYLHRMQRVYEKELERMQEIIDNSRDNKEISAATKRKEKLQKQLKETKEYDAKVAHLALSRIGIDLDDGVKVNYEKVQTASDGTKLDILAKI